MNALDNEGSDSGYSIGTHFQKSFPGKKLNAARFVQYIKEKMKKQIEVEHGEGGRRVKGEAIATYGVYCIPFDARARAFGHRRGNQF